jgi:hypothetical protein
MNSCASATILACCIGLAACGPTNDPLFGRVEATVGRYQVVVTDCHTFSLPKVDNVEEGGQRFAPCKDSVVTIKGDELFVNGEGYGQLVEGDRVVVEHGKVRVDHRQ